MISMIALAFMVTQAAQLPDGHRIPMGWCEGSAKPQLPPHAHFIGKERKSITPCGPEPVKVRRAPLPIQQGEV